MLAVFVDHSLPFLYFKIIFYFMCLGVFCLLACLFYIGVISRMVGQKRVSDPTKQQYWLELPCGCESPLLKSTQSC